MKSSNTGIPTSIIRAGQLITEAVMLKIHLTIVLLLLHYQLISFTKGIFPDILKVAKVIPMHTKKFKNQSFKLQTNIAFNGETNAQ